MFPTSSRLAAVPFSASSCAAPTRSHEARLCHSGCNIPLHSHSIFQWNSRRPLLTNDLPDYTQLFPSCFILTLRPFQPASPLSFLPWLLSLPFSVQLLSLSSNSVYYCPLCIWRGRQDYSIVHCSAPIWAALRGRKEPNHPIRRTSCVA